MAVSPRMIEAGTREQVKWGDGNWLFLDVGFSANKSSSGLLVSNGKPCCVQFGEATRRIVDHVTRSTCTTNLLIEAPLSVCFNKSGNPTGRLIEKEAIEGKTKTRYWHNGLGCSVMVAAMYLIRDISEAAPTSQVRLFEGFVSYKDRTVKTDHCADVELLREVVKDPGRFAECIISVDGLRGPDDKIVSAFKVCGSDCGVPAVIKRQVRPSEEMGSPGCTA
jgi:hypothetical protein